MIFALLFEAFETYLLYINATRVNLEWGISDYYLNVFLRFFGLSIKTTLTILPSTVILSHIVPVNVEATMISVITSCLYLNYDWGGEMMTAYLCDIYVVGASDYTNYSSLIVSKFSFLLISILSVGLFPSNL